MALRRQPLLRRARNDHTPSRWRLQVTHARRSPIHHDRPAIARDEAFFDLLYERLPGCPRERKPALLRALVAHPDIERRAELAAGLGRHAADCPEAVTQVLRALARDEIPAVRVAAAAGLADVLAAMNPGRRHREIGDWTASAEPRVRAALARALARLEPGAALVAPLERLAVDRYIDVREAAVVAAAHQLPAAPRRLAQLLLHACDDNRRPVRLAALRGLARAVALVPSRTILATLLDRADGDDAACAELAIDALTAAGARSPRRVLSSLAALAAHAEELEPSVLEHLLGSLRDLGPTDPPYATRILRALELHTPTWLRSQARAMRAQLAGA
jgi:hypothetical protein